MCVQIQLKAYTGEEFKLEVEIAKTVAELKTQIEEEKGIPVATMRLVFTGKQLQDPLTLQEYNIVQGSVIQLLLSLLSAKGDRENEATITLELAMVMKAVETNSSMRQYERCVLTSTASNTAEGDAEVAFGKTDQFKMWEMPRGTIVTATYQDSLPFSSTSDVAVVSRKGTLQVAPRVIGMDRTISITVTDADLNQNSSQIETGFVSVMSTWSEESLEQVVLTENARDSQIFTGLLRTILNADPSPGACRAESGCFEPLSTDPAVHVREGDELFVSYRDVGSNTVQTEPVNDITVKVRVGVTGTASIQRCDGVGPSEICKGVLLGGDVLSLTVVDFDVGYQERGSQGWSFWVSEDITNEAFKASLPVTVTTSKDSEVETVVLYAAQSLEGVYTGFLDTCMGTKHCTPREGVVSEAACEACSPNIQGHSNNGVLTVRPGDHLTVSYADAMPEGERTGTIKVARIGVLRLSPSKKVEMGDQVAITLIDDDVNMDLASPDTTQVRLASPIVGEPSQQITLAETGADTGHFTGVFSTCLTCDSIDGRVRVEAGDFITVTYEDQNVPAVADDASIVSSVVAASDTTIFASPKVIMPGDLISVTVKNTDVRQSTDSVEVSVVKVPSSDAEHEVMHLEQAKHQGTLVMIIDAFKVELGGDILSDTDNLYVDGKVRFGGADGQVLGITRWDAGIDCSSSLPCRGALHVDGAIDTAVIGIGTPVEISKWGQYEGVLETKLLDPVRAPKAGDGAIEVDAGMKIAFSVNDDAPYATLIFEVMVAQASNLETYWVVSAGQPAFAVQMRDFDANRDDLVIENVPALVTSSRNTESEQLTLVETGAATGVFSSLVPLVYSKDGGSNNDGQLWGLPGDLLTITYSDNEPETLHSIVRALAFAATVDIPQPVFAADRPLVVTVVDADLNQDRHAPDVARGVAILKEFPAGDSESLTLIETAETSNVFTAQIQARLLQEACCAPLWLHKASAPAEDDNGIIEMALDGSLTLQYSESLPAGHRMANSTAKDLGKTEITFSKSTWPSPATPVANLHITVTDTDIPSGTLVPLEVGNLVESENVIVFLQEAVSTDHRGGQYTGVMQVYPEAPDTPLAPPAALVRWGQELHLRYQDSLPAETVMTVVRMPSPDFAEPTPVEGHVLSTAQNCPLLQLLKVEDTSGFQVEMVATRFWSGSDWHGLPAHDPQAHELPCSTASGAWVCQKQGSHAYPAGHGLMPGASLEDVVSTVEEQQQEGGKCPQNREVATACGVERRGVQTAVLSWTASNDDTGRVWTQCFLSRHVGGAVVGAERCFRIHVQRCHRCAMRDESLHSIASEIGTEWRLLFTINPDLRHFSELPSGMRIKTGLLYRAASGDTVQSVGVRFGVMLEYLLRANPEARSSAVMPGDDVCVAPALMPMDACPPQPKSSTWEPIEEQYVPPDYWDNPFNWEDIKYTDPRGYPTKVPNPLYPQRPQGAEE